MNGDGHDDVIIGAYPFDSGQANEGRAYAYLGSPGTAFGSRPLNVSSRGNARFDEARNATERWRRRPSCCGAVPCLETSE